MKSEKPQLKIQSYINLSEGHQSFYFLDFNF